MTADETRQNQGEEVTELTGIQHLARFCEHVPLIGVAARYGNENLPEGWRKIVYGAIAAVLGASITAIPVVLWSLYSLIQENQIRTIRTNQKLNQMERRIDEISDRIEHQGRLLRQTREQLLNRTQRPP